MPQITVAQDRCASAAAGTTLYTYGLDSCIGIVAYGWPAQANGVNKVMAHASGLYVHDVMTQFVHEVQSSGMSVAGICMSCPKIDRNDSGPNKISDKDIKQAIAATHGIREKDVTKEQIKQYRDGLALALADTQDYVEGVCINSLGIGPVAHQRSNSRAADPAPYGTMRATASPGGQVQADGHKLADIPDPVATGSHGGNYASASGSSHHAGSGSSSGLKGGHSSSSGSHHSSSSYGPSGGHSSSSAKPSGYSSSSARPSSTTSSSKLGSSSSSSSGSHRPTTTTSSSSSARVPHKSSSTLPRR